MLIACQNCHRQYDVRDLAAGSKVRCACGKLNVVPRRRPRRAEVVRCANCGAARAGAGPCEYCRARPKPEAHGDPCPECFARLSAKARFCHACGVEQRPETVVRAVSRRQCPSCAGAMVVAEGRGDPFHQCTACGGLWLSQPAFRRFAERSAGRPVTWAEQSSTSRLVRGGRSSRRRARTRKRRSQPPLDCPACKSPMIRTVYAEYPGVEVDLCLRHGWWFDAEELERVGRFIEGGGLEQAKRRRQSARRARSRVAAWKRRVATEYRESLGLLLLG